jgi:hypothetical protein
MVFRMIGHVPSKFTIKPIGSRGSSISQHIVSQFASSVLSYQIKSQKRLFKVNAFTFPKMTEISWLCDVLVQ